jgi:hypothetical protein
MKKCDPRAIKEKICTAVAHPGNFSGRGGVQHIQLKTEGRENGDLGAVAP